MTVTTPGPAAALPKRKEVRHTLSVWMDGGSTADEVLFRTKSTLTSTSEADTYRLIETVWRLCRKGSAFSGSRFVADEEMPHVQLDWSIERIVHELEDGTARLVDVHCLWAELFGQQWDTGVRAAWRLEEEAW